MGHTKVITGFLPIKRVNFPVVGFAAHAVAAICYFAASVILIYALTADDDNPLFVPKDRKRFIPRMLSSILS